MKNYLIAGYRLRVESELDLTEKGYDELEDKLGLLEDELDELGEQLRKALAKPLGETLIIRWTRD
jgi:hypothetical protein